VRRYCTPEPTLPLTYLTKPYLVSLGVNRISMVSWY
jgi:hypothetical protein